MDKNSQQIVREIVGSVRRVTRAIYLESKQMMREFGITGPQSITLRAIADRGEVSSTELAKMLFVTPANMTGIVDRLEKRKLVRRVKNKKDRRVTLIVLTNQGREIIEKLPDPIESKLVEGLGDLPPAEIFGIYSAFTKVVDLIDAGKVTTGPLDPDPTA